MSDITISGTRVNGLVAWDGTTISAFTRPRIDTPALSGIHALILRDDGRLYAAAGGVFIWDGEGWTPIEGAPSGAMGIAFHKNNVYFGGSFSHAAGRRSSHFAWYREARDATPIEKNPGSHGLHLAQSFPNPFQKVTTIAFTLPTHAHASLAVYDLLGRVVSRPIDRILAAGSHSVTVESTDLPNGTYYYRLQAEDVSITRQFVVVE